MGPRAASGFTMNDRRLSIIRLALVAVLLIYTVLVVRANSARDVDFDRIGQALTGAPGLENLDPLDENAFQERFGTAPEGAEGWLLYGSGDLMDVSELMIAKVPDERARNALEDAAQSRVDEQKRAFLNYGTNQTQLLEHALLYQRGSYLFYGVSEDVELWEERFLSCVG